MNSVDIATLALRLVVGGTMIAHGWNHAFGGGRLPGTARWFESIGIRPGRVHALFATVTELGAGALLVLGLLTPLAAAAVIGTMVVALVANHARNGTCHRGARRRGWRGAAAGHVLATCPGRVHPFPGRSRSRLVRPFRLVLAVGPVTAAAGS